MSVVTDLRLPVSIIVLECRFGDFVEKDGNQVLRLSLRVIHEGILHSIL